MLQADNKEVPASIDPEFIVSACSWMQNPARKFLGFIWLAYENMIATLPQVDTRDLERSITQLLEPRVSDVMTGDEPFYIQHGPYERETMQAPPAQRQNTIWRLISVQMRELCGLWKQKSWKTPRE